MSFTNTMETSMLDHIYTDPAFSPPATLYLGLSSTTPAEDGSNVTEPSGGAYARVAHAAAQMDAAVAGAPSSKDNGTELAFPQASASWGAQLTHALLYSASTGGTLYAYGALTVNKTIDAGDVARFSAGDYILTMD